MSGQVSRGSAGEYQADEREGVTRLSMIGIGVALLLLIPGNMIIHAVAGSNDVNASLPVLGAISLIALSTILTLIGGFIPSKKAAKKDPVAALRSE